MEERTFDPIGECENYDCGLFAPIPLPQAGYAYVLTSTLADSPPLVIQAGRIPAKPQIRAGRYNRKTRVDIRRHSIAFQMEAEAKDNISKFQIEVSAIAQVKCPEDAFAENITDVTMMVKAILGSQIQEIADRVDAECTRELQERILAAVGNIISLDCGLTLDSINIQVKLDPIIAEYRKGHQKAQLETDLKHKQAELAEEISQDFADPTKAIFAGVVEGKISPEEALKRLNASSSADFDEQMRRVQSIMELAKSMQDSDICSPGTLNEQAAELISGLLRGVPAAAMGAMEPCKELDTSEKQDQTYALPED